MFDYIQNLLNVVNHFWTFRDGLDITKTSAPTEVVILLGYPAQHYFIFVDKLLQDKKKKFLARKL